MALMLYAAVTEWLSSFLSEQASLLGWDGKYISLLSVIHSDSAPSTPLGRAGRGDDN